MTRDLDKLLFKRDEGLCDAADEEALAALLKGSAGARRALVQHYQLTSLIVSDLGSQQAAQAEIAKLVGTDQPSSRRLRTFALALVAMLALLVPAWAYHRAKQARKIVAATVEETPAATRAPQPSPAPRLLPPGPLPPLPRTSVTKQEVAALEQVPPALLVALVNNSVARDAEQRQRLGARCSGDRRFALEALTAGKIAKEPSLIETGWRVLEEVIAVQQAEGNFGDDAGCTAYFLGHLTHALLLLDEASLGSSRYEKALASTRRALAFLLQPRNLESLRRQSRGKASRQALYGQAFALSAVLLRNPEAQKHADRLLQQVLSMQRSDGSFRFGDSHDSGYQATILWRLAWWHFYAPRAELAQAIETGGQWLIGRVREDGRINITLNKATTDCSHHDPRFGTCFSVNYAEVTWALVYLQALGIQVPGRSPAGDLAQRVHLMMSTYKDDLPLQNSPPRE